MSSVVVVWAILSLIVVGCGLNVHLALNRSSRRLAGIREVLEDIKQDLQRMQELCGVVRPTPPTKDMSND